jgi:hypothetical protein
MNEHSADEAAVDACARYSGRGWPPHQLRMAGLLSHRQYLAAERLLDDALDGCSPELVSNPFGDLALNMQRGHFNMNRHKMQAVGARCVTDALAVLNDDARAAVLSVVISAEPAHNVSALIRLRWALDRLAQQYEERPFDDEAASWLDLMRVARAPLRALLAPTPYNRGESSGDWLAPMASNPLGLQALHLLYCERLQMTAHYIANGAAVITEDFPVFLRRIALDLYGG